MGNNHIPKRRSRTAIFQKTRLSTSEGNLLRMLINEWKGRDGTLRKWDCGVKRSGQQCGFRDLLSLTSGSRIRCSRPRSSTSLMSPPSRALMTRSPSSPANEGRDPSKLPFQFGNNCKNQGPKMRLTFVHTTTQLTSPINSS